MTKSIPSGEHTEWIWCQNCETWYKESGCTSNELHSVSDDEGEFTSDYNGRIYYSSGNINVEYVWQCPNGCWIWDPNDEDVSTPSRFSGVLYMCSDCYSHYDNKNDADNCCWKDD